MDNYETFQAFFTKLGLTVTKSVRTGSFGDLIVEACSSDLCLKGVSDRSFESIEVCSASDPNELFIMNIVMSFVLNERRLVEEIGIEEQMKFVETHLTDLEKLFAEGRYHTTKSALMELVAIRGRILFPKW